MKTMPSCGSQLVFISGKGGVGKTVVATALALAEAQRGRRVLLVEMNGRDQVAALLKVPPVGYTMQEVRPGIHAIDIHAQEAIREYVLLVLHFEALYKAVFENRLVRHLIQLVPSLSEMVMLGKIGYHAQETQQDRARFDVIVIDAPATGHVQALLQAPQQVRSAMPSGPMHQHAQDLEDMLTDPNRTRLHVVTTPEAMPVTEAQELLTFMGSVHIATGPLIINQRLPPVPQAALEAVAPLKDDPRSQHIPEALHRRALRFQAGEQALKTLDPHHLAHAVDLPWMRLDPLALQRLADCLKPCCSPTPR